MLRNIKKCLKVDARCMKLCIVENNAQKKARKTFFFCDESEIYIGIFIQAPGIYYTLSTYT